MLGAPADDAIGILADSHGRLAALTAGVRYLRAQGCARLYHLGDICDSSRPETADACVALLRARGVIAVKGNNDHALVVNRGGRIGALVRPETLDYLEQLPLVLPLDGALLMHSLPFAEELGPACMIRDLDRDQTRRVLARFPQHTLFRGHGHAPAIAWRGADGPRAAALRPGQLLELADRVPCVITCGALEQGFCMIWRPAQRTVLCGQTPRDDRSPS